MCDHCPFPHLKPKQSFLQSRPQEVSLEAREVQWANLMTNSLPRGHFFLEELAGSGKVCPICSLSSSALPRSLLYPASQCLKRAGCAVLECGAIPRGRQGSERSELPMLSKTFSYSSNNRAFMEMANLGFQSYFPPTTLLPPALSCPAENPPLLG